MKIKRLAIMVLIICFVMNTFAPFSALSAQIANDVIPQEVTSWTINGKTIPKPGLENGTFYGFNDCWNFAQEIYGYLWNGAYFTSYRGTSDDMLRNLSDSQRRITADNAKAFLLAAPSGAVIRVMEYTNSHDGEVNGKYGHSMILLSRDSNGLYIYDDWDGYVRIKWFSWEGFASSMSYYVYFKYVKYPNASPYSTTPKYVFDINGYLDGEWQTGLMNYGSFDIYINGHLEDSGRTDFYGEYEAGTTYEIKNIRATTGHVYNGVASGSLSGTINEQTVVLLSFSTADVYIFDVNGYLDGEWQTNLQNYGTFDIYINGSLEDTGRTDFYAELTEGTTYEIKNVKATSGHVFNGAASGSLSGTITEQTVVLLSFSTLYTVTLKDGLTGGIIATASVGHGSNVAFPTPPAHDGYTFTGWDKDGKNITSDTTITALYKQDEVPTPTPTATPTPTPTSIPENAPQAVTESKTTQAGQTVTVAVNMKNNPGFMYMRAVPVYDSSVMTLTAVANGIYPSTTVNLSNPSYIWEADQNITGDGVLLTLTFTLKEDTEAGAYAVGISVKECYNYDEDDVTIYAVNGTITVTDILYGDCNGDGVVDGKDLVRLRKYLSQYDDETGTSPIEISAGADCNGDGKIDGKDLVRLRKYLSQYDDDTGTSPIHLGPEN